MTNPLRTPLSLLRSRAIAARWWIAFALAGTSTACGDDDRDAAVDTGDVSATDDADASDSEATDTGDTQPDPQDLDTPEPDGDTFGELGDDVADATEPLPSVCDTPDGSETPYLLGNWEVRVQEPTGAWTIVPPGAATPTMRASVTCVDGVPTQLVRRAVGAPGVRAAFGRFDMDMISRRSPLRWQDWDGTAVSVANVDEVLSISFPVADGPAVVLTFSVNAQGDLRIGVAPDADGERSSTELRWDCGASEAFFGLGTQVTGMDLRGRRYPLFTQEQGNGKPEGGGGFPLQNVPEAAYAPMGVWHTTAGYSALLDGDGFHEIDLCREVASQVILRAHPDTAALVLVQGETAAERISQITSYTGRPPSVPDWAFGPWNDAVGGPQRLRVVAETLRAARIPSSAIWSEDWIGGEQTATGFRLSYAWEADVDRYPNLGALIDGLHADGFAFLGYFNTFVPEPTRMFAEGEAGDFLVKKADGTTYRIVDPAFRQAGLVDLTNPDAAAWLASYFETAAALGIDGWMADFTEWMPVDAVLADGSDPWTYHNRWPLDFQRLNLETLRRFHADDPRGADDFVFFARSGWASTQGGTAGLATALWAGDQDTSWDTQDGFATIFPIQAHVGLAGVAMVGTDIAGYSSLSHPNTTKELFYRWASAGAFSPLMRTHHGSDECGNWSFDRDAETLAHYGRWASVHARLFPTWRSLFAEAQATGMPILRHPWLVEPNNRSIWEDGAQYFIGDDLLVAPVVTEGATNRQVALPASGWWPLFASSPLAGEATMVTVDAPVTALPVFVRPGTGVVLLARHVDSFYGATSPEVVDLDDVAHERLVALYPTPDGAVRGTAVLDGTLHATIAQFTTPFVDLAFDGEALATCGEPATAPCVTADGTRALLTRPAATTGELTWTGPNASVRWDGPADRVVHLAVAGAAWDDLAVEPPAPDLASEAPPVCDSVPGPF